MKKKLLSIDQCLRVNSVLYFIGFLFVFRWRPANKFSITAKLNKKPLQDLRRVAIVFCVAIFFQTSANTQITSFTPATAGTGTTIYIKGSGFSGTTSISFGNTPAGSYSVVSDTLITAVVAAGSTGSIVVTISSGSFSLPGFTFCVSNVPAPVISVSGPTTFCLGDSTSVTGRFGVGNSLKLNGSNQSVDIGTWFNYQTFTISLWVKPGATQVQYADILDNNHTDNRSFVLQQNSTNTNQYYFGIEVPTTSPITYFNLTANVWQHIALVSTPTRKLVFVNGVLKSTTVATGLIVYDNTQYLRLGRWGGGGRNWNGEMDEVRIYDDSLTQAQIMTEMNVSVSPASAHLIAYYKMDENSGAAIATATGNHTGTLINGPSFVSSAVPVIATNYFYQWQPAGVSSNPFIIKNSGTYTLLGKDNFNCASSSPPVTVNVTALTPAVSIAASATTITPGTSVTFTATPFNGGSNPSYKWIKNGIVIGGASGSAFVTSALNNGDTISCVLTSNAVCATSATAISNKIIIISLLPQTISFPPLSDKTFGDTAFQINATASSGLPAGFTIKSGSATIDANNYVTLNGAGTVTIEAGQAGDGNYSAAPPAPQTFTVYKATQSITFTADSSANGYVLNAASSVGLPVSFAVSGNGSVNGNVLTFIGPGLVSVTASSGGNQNYAAASVVKTFCVPAPVPGSISGYQQACPGNQSYQVTALPNVSYKWSISGGGTITSATTNNTVTVNWMTVGNYTLTVAAYTSCDTVNKQYSSLAVAVLNNNLPDAAINLYPNNGTVITAFPFSLSWKQVANASAYDVYIWKASLTQPSTPAVAGLTQIGLAVTPDLITNLSPGTTYNWRVVAKNGCGSASSAINNFFVSDLPNLKMRKVDAAPSVFAGTAIDVRAEVINIGNAATGEAHWIDAVYLSDDATVGNDIYLGGSGNVRALAPNEFYENVIRVQLPYNIRIGKWYILVRTNTMSSTLGEMTTTDNTGVDSLQILTPDVPDLKMQSPVTVSPSDPFSGQPLQIHYTVKNGGTAAAQNTHWNDYIYLSPDSGLNSNNINTATRIGIVSYNGGVLKKDSFYTVNATVNLPVRLFGRLFVYVVANAESSFYELFRNDNLGQTQAFTITLTPPPDFVITDMSGPATAAGGERITVAWDVKNAGASAPNRQETIWSDGVYFSTDSVFDFSTATFLGRNSTLPVPTMNVGESYHHSLDVNIPANAPDSGWLFVYTDMYNQVFEYNKEGNNTARRKIRLLNPDLVIDSIAVTDSALAGTTIDVEYRLKNIGSGKAFPVNRLDKFWLSSNPVYISNDLTPLAAPTLAHALDTAGSVLLLQSVTIPKSFAGPTGYIYVDADYRNDLPEKSENNNRIRSNPITITHVTYPDLAPSNLQLASSALLTDQAYGITYTVTNNGPADVVARTWKDAIYISTNPVWSIGTAKRIRDIPQSMTLLQGASYSVTDSIRVDLSTLNGADSNRYYVFVFTDADNVITEQTTSNNTARSSQVSVGHLPFPDLTVTQASGADSATSGGRLLITYTVKNTGGTYGFSPYWYDGIYFSKDPLWDGSDGLAAGSRMITTTLATGDSYTLSIYVTVPTGISGAYYLLMTTDYSGLNQDQNRSNNYKVVAVRIGNGMVEGPVYVTFVPPSDLAATTLQSPSVGVAGQPVTVKWKVVNGRHVTDKSAWVDKIVLSGDDKVDNGDPVLFTYARSGKLDSAAYYIDSAQVFLPATAAGNAYLLLKTDANDGVYESDEVNNTAASLIFITQPAPSDLIVTAVSAADSAIIGDSTVLTWVVQNVGANAATGIMRQGIYFNNDSLWNDSAALVYSGWDQINLPPLSADTFTRKVKLKSVDAGTHYAIIRTDLLNNIPEGNEQNNTTAAAQSTLLTVPLLPLNVRTAAVLKNDDELYYRIEVPDSFVGGAILLSLSGDSVNTTNELYVRFDHLPSRITYDVAFDRSASGLQQIVIPDLKKGTYYILAYGHSALHNPQPVSLLAEVIDFKIRSVFTNTGGNTGLVTVKINGARFEAGMQAILFNNTADSVQATRVIFQNSTLLYATFNLANRKTGQYTLRLLKMNNDTASLVNGFSIVAGTAGGVANNGGPPGFYCHIQNIDADDLMDLRSNYPPSVVRWRLYATDIVYGNSGNIDIPIQEYILTCLTNLPVNEDPTVILRGLAQLLGGQLPSTLLQIFMTLKDPDVPDVLRPGFQASRRFYSALPSAGEFRYRLLQK